MNQGQPILRARDLHTYYGNIHALQGASLAVCHGEIVTLIGSNGAGKSTLLNTICGLVRPREGEVLFNGEHLERLPPHKIVSAGISQVPEGRKIFSRLTVIENLEMGAYLRKHSAGVKKDMEALFALFPRLKERCLQIAGTLSGGEQQMLAIGRALMARPKLLLLDEPSMGLAPILVETIFQNIQDVNRTGTPVLLVEQNALMALQIASRGYVIQNGRIALEDETRALKKNDMVRTLYLGGESE
jgi:branched-chain amino acid transport system ATP-binding protein